MPTQHKQSYPSLQEAQKAFRDHTFSRLGPACSDFRKQTIWVVLNGIPHAISKDFDVVHFHYLEFGYVCGEWGFSSIWEAKLLEKMIREGSKESEETNDSEDNSTN